MGGTGGRGCRGATGTATAWDALPIARGTGQSKSPPHQGDSYGSLHGAPPSLFSRLKPSRAVERTCIPARLHWEGGCRPFVEITVGFYYDSKQDSAVSPNWVTFSTVVYCPVYRPSGLRPSRGKAGSGSGVASWRQRASSASRSPNRAIESGMKRHAGSSNRASSSPSGHQSPSATSSGCSVTGPSQRTS